MDKGFAGAEGGFSLLEQRLWLGGFRLSSDWLRLSSDWLRLSSD
jgi:hypothetical protein